MKKPTFRVERDMPLDGIVERKKTLRNLASDLKMQVIASVAQEGGDRP